MPTSTPDTSQQLRNLLPILVPLGLLCGVWLVLVEGAASSWIIGIPTVVAAAWSVRRLQAGSARRVSVVGLLRFTPLFIVESLRGGIDVAIRTLAPQMRIAPGFAHYDTGLQQHAARVFFANCVSLLPGTLAADLQGQRLTLHLLDARIDPEAELQRLERAVARIYTDSDCLEGATPC